MNKGVWKATDHSVSKSWTRLKRLSTCTHGSFIPIFLRNLLTVLQSGVSIYIPTNSARGFPFLIVYLEFSIYVYS